MPTQIERMRAGYPRLVVTVLVAATVINLITLPFLRVRARPVWRHGAGDLAHLIVTDDQTTAWRYGIYAELGRIGAAGRIVVPLGSWFDPYVARNLAGVTVEERDIGRAIISLPPGLRAMGLLQVDGELMSYWILPGPSTNQFWLAEVEGGFAVVPATLEPVPEVPGG